jgi:hypothetical protein
MAIGSRSVAPPPASLHQAGDGVHRAVQLLQCLIGTATVLAVAWLGWSLLGGQRGVGWMAALGLAVYPPHVSAAAYPQAALWAALVLACLVALAVSPRWQSSRAGAVMIGSLAGVLILLEPVLVWAAPICLAIFWWGKRPAHGAGRLGAAGLGRLLIPVGVTLAILGCWYGGSWLAGALASQLPGEHGRFCMERLREFLLSGTVGSAGGEGRLQHFATIACLVLALMGCCTSWPRWRALWPTLAILAAVTLSDMWGLIPARSRLSIEPLVLLWAALAVVPPLARLLGARSIRVYRPGERAEDPFGGAHVLRGPHYDVGVRRRAG